MYNVFMITKLDEKNFDEYTKSGLKVVEFFAEWCGYCKRQKPILEEMEKVNIGQIDAEKSPSIARKFNVNGFPTMIIMKNGNEVDRLVGFHSKYDIMNVVMKYLK